MNEPMMDDQLQHLRKALDDARWDSVGFKSVRLLPAVELDAIAGALAKATPGEWNYTQRISSTTREVLRDEIWCSATTTSHAKMICDNMNEEADAKCTALLHNAAPAWLAETLALRAEVKALRDEIQRGAIAHEWADLKGDE
jgi:hypothetical protein